MIFKINNIRLIRFCYYVEYCLVKYRYFSVTPHNFITNSLVFFSVYLQIFKLKFNFHRKKICDTTLCKY